MSGKLERKARKLEITEGFFRVASRGKKVGRIEESKAGDDEDGN